MRLGSDQRPASMPFTIMTERGLRWPMRIVTAVTVMFALLGLFFVVHGAMEWNLAARSASWPTVAGTVTRSEVTSHHSTHKGQTTTSYHARIEFDYEVDGVGHHGDQRTYKVVTSSQSAANEAVATYPVGRSVTVSFDPTDPGRAVLEPGGDWTNAIPIAIGLFAIVFVSLMRWFAVSQMRKAMQRMKDLQAMGISPPTGQTSVAQSVPSPGAEEPTPTATEPTRATGPAELKPTFHDDLPGSR
ncbi:MAG: DUF3592 domain-containing protein [Planctomycetes bacterium]|nr:DUF3592 domain-containing protein [Planctomycetota bacterium]